MRKIVLGLMPILMALPTSAIAEAAPSWRVSEASGDVRLTEQGRSRSVVRGALLASGSSIVTGPRARAVIVRGEEFVVISPNTQLRLPAAENPNKLMQIIEDFGTAVYKITKKATPHFGVQTPYLAAVVKGTTFTVTVGPQGGSVQVTEGAVEVSTLDGGAMDLITPGGIATVGASDLYQLTVDGDDAKVLRSQQAPAAGSHTSASPLASSSLYAGPISQPAQIIEAVGEESYSLGSATGGLIDGDLGIETAMVQAADVVRDIPGNPGNEGGAVPGSDNPGNGGEVPGVDNPGNGGEAPGGDNPGNGGEAPGVDNPGNGGEAPGVDNPGNGGEAPGVDNPGNGGEAPGVDNPGNGGEAPGVDNPGHGGEAPGVDNPGNGGEAPGVDNPGHGGEVPGTDNPGNGGEGEGLPGPGEAVPDSDGSENSGSGSGSSGSGSGSDAGDSSGPGSGSDDSSGPGGDDCLLGLVCLGLGD